MAMPVPGPQHRRSELLPSWPTLAAYRADDPQRRASREVLFGSNWCTRQDAPPCRAVWVQTTGEFIVVRLDAVVEEECGPVQLLGTFPDLGIVEIGLRAWPNVHGWAGSLPWLEARIAGLAKPAEPSRAQDDR
jgi:hypothetical protein